MKDKPSIYDHVHEDLGRLTERGRAPACSSNSECLLSRGLNEAATFRLHVQMRVGISVLWLVSRILHCPEVIIREARNRHALSCASPSSQKLARGFFNWTLEYPETLL
jgi:hypothetical protein